MLKSLKREYLDSPYTEEYPLHEVEEEHFQDWKKEYTEERDKKKLWEQIGFHRPIAGFWHNFMLQLLVIILPAVYAGFLLGYLYPFPEMRGLRIQYTNIFVLVFTIFDLGTSATISRFIADENIKNPNEMVKYIQYFIWYQAITGLIQVTAISWWAINVANESELALGIWIMLVVSTKQWPGFPGVFKGLLDSLQLYSKKNIIAFFQTGVIEVFTEAIFIIAGRAYGEAHPEIGAVLGTAIGGAFGTYFDDIIASLIGALILSKELKPYGITFKRFFMVEFDMDIFKKCFFFGVKMGAPGLLSAFVRITALTLSIKYIPQYTVFLALADIANMLVATSERLVEQDFTALFVESYQNDAKRLCQYYNAHAVRFKLINTGFAVSIMLMIISVLPIVFLGINLESYLPAVPFLIPALLVRCFKPYKNYPPGLLVAGHRPNELMILNTVLSIFRLIAWYLTIEVFKVHELGMIGIVYCLVLTEFPIDLLGFIVSFLFIQKKILKIKFASYQTFIVPIISTTILYLVFTLLKNTILLPMFDKTLYGAIVLALVFVVLLVLLGYFPMTVFLGGWDRNSIEHLEKAVEMSGASKLLVIPITYFILKAKNHSRLHDRFGLNEDDALKDIYYLTKIREINREEHM